MCVLILVCYYHFFILENLGQDFDSFKEHLYRISDRVATTIRRDYPDHDKIAGFLNDVSQRENVKIAVFDIDGHRIFHADRRRDFGASIELKNFIVLDQQKIFVLEFSYPFSLKSFSEITSIQNIRNLAALLLLAVILLLILYLHYALVKPLTLLHRGLESINYRNTRLSLPIHKQDELGDLARKFQAMLSRIETARRQQSEMIASISHDLKTPLTSILGYLERLLDGRVASENRRQEYLRIIDHKAREINGLISQFNDYALNDLDDDQMVTETVPVQQFFDGLCQEYTAELQGLGVQVHCGSRLPENIGIAIDVVKIRRVFANIISNSIKYAAGLSRVTMNCAVAKNEVRFAIEDDGPGVPAAELGAIFDKFYRVEKSRSREKGGSGLGLAICRNIVESHGGTIWAYRPEDGGLGIAFSLPIQILHKN